MASLTAWKTFVWGVFLYETFNDDASYRDLFRDTAFLDRLLRNAGDFPRPSEFREKVIDGFLNPWKCRLPSSERAAKAILSEIRQITPSLRALSHVGLASSDEPDFAICAECYRQIRKAGYKVGPTAASKILHVLQPAFFVMWDKRILESYASSNPEIVDSGRGYSIFLRAMKQFASELRSEFRSEMLRESKPQMDIIDYLHEKLPFDPAKTLAKYLDEYNWVAKTRNVNLPPAWHPCSP